MFIAKLPRCIHFKGNLERCPHPGIPIGGYMKGFAGDYGFVVGGEVEFSCWDGLVLVGEKKQECLFIKEWSGDGAPDCVGKKIEFLFRNHQNTILILLFLDPKYSDSPSDVINKLSQSTSNIRQTKKFSRSGRTIQLNSRGRIEVYFVIDLSLSVGAGALGNTMSFAKSLVKRVSDFILNIWLNNQKNKNGIKQNNAVEVYEHEAGAPVSVRP